MKHAEKVAEIARAKLESQGIADGPFSGNAPNGKTPLRSLGSEQLKLLLKNSISPLPLHKTLVLLESLSQHRNGAFDKYERLALSKSLVQTISNLHFGPEVGVGPAKEDALVIDSWLDCVRCIAADLRALGTIRQAKTEVLLGDARQIGILVEPRSIDAVITSPPYPNEKDYTRTTRLESVLLGFIKTKDDLWKLKQGLVRSNTRNVYKFDDDDRWVKDHSEISRIAEAIEHRRIELGKTSGFERLYGRVAKLYFGGMARHLAELRQVLRPGARLAYVVGDQASYLRVMIRTGNLIADIAQSLGYEVDRIDLFRTRLATATKEQLREEVVVLRWPKKAFLKSQRPDRTFVNGHLPIGV